MGVMGVRSGFKALSFILLFFHCFLIKGQCDVAITGIDLNTYEVTIEVINSEGCTANGPGGINGAVTMLQIGYHLPEPINPDNEIIEDFNEAFGLPPCSPQWDANGWYLGQNPDSFHPGWWYSPSTSVTFQEEIMGDGLVTGDVVVIPLNPPGDYENYPTPLAECGDDLIDYWLSEGECIEFVVWQLNYGATWYENNGGWATGDGPGTYQDQNCNNSWYLCRDNNPGPAVASSDACQFGCMDPLACNFDQTATNSNDSCVFCYTPYVIGSEICNAYHNDDSYWDWYLGLFPDCELPPLDTIYVELPCDTVTILETDTLYITQYDTIIQIDTLPIAINWYFYDTTYIYVELPPDTVIETVVEVQVITDTLYVELPPDTVIETEFIFETDTIFEIEILFITDTLYITLTDTIVEYQFIEVDCATGLPCNGLGFNQCDPLTVFIPNTFTPNNDGYNDVWEVVLDPGCWEEVDVKVYNRWGDLMWESFDPYYVQWDGSYNNGAYYVPDGVYYWTFTGRKINTTVIEDLQGHVTIFR
jgi:gliding motility-associated-like protein